MSTHDLKITAWQNASIVPGHYPAFVRRDAFGWFIHWADYGNRASTFGWEIDHIRPTALGGVNSVFNVRALHWHNNARLGGLLSNHINKPTQRRHPFRGLLS